MVMYEDAGFRDNKREEKIMKNNLWLKLGLPIALLALVSIAAFAADPAQLDRKAHRTVTGTIQKITSDAIFVKTQEGTVRNFGIKEAKTEGMKDFKAGDPVLVEFDEGNQIIDIEKVSPGEMKGHKDPHAVVTGTVTGFDRVKKTVSLKLPDGTTKTYELKDAAATKMSGVKTGTKVAMEIDEENNLAMDFDLK